MQTLVVLEIYSLCVVCLAWCQNEISIIDFNTDVRRSTKLEKHRY